MPTRVAHSRPATLAEPARGGPVDVLLLGGTTQARELAGCLAATGHSVVSSLAGEVSDPLPSAGEVRVGGFGGVAGLVAYLREHALPPVVDATHPFAARITANAVAACAITGAPLRRLSRPSWASRPDAASWLWVDSLAQARESLPDHCRAFLAIGRHGLGEFAAWADRFVLARVVDLPDGGVPAAWEVRAARGPFCLESELELMRSRRIDVLIVKDSGGPTDAKLDAAARLGVRVVALRRPSDPVGLATVETVGEAVNWVRERWRRS